jgi:hypothetical protein
MGDDSKWFAMAALNLVFVVPQCYTDYGGGIISASDEQNCLAQVGSPDCQLC